MASNISTGLAWSETGLASSSEIDVRSEVEEILQNRGYYVFLRKARAQYSPTWEASRGESRDSDPFNHTTGHMYDDYLVLIRKVPTVEMQAGPGREVRSDLGIMGPRKYLIYMKHPPIDTSTDTLPTINDQIIEVTLDETTRLPKRAYNIERVYDIQQTHEFRDQNGRIEYWSLLVEQQVIGK